MLPQLVNTGFQVLFTLLGVLFSPFLHSTMRYRSLRSISLGVVPPTSRKVSVSLGTLILLLPIAFMYGLSPSLAGLSRTIPLTNRLTYAVLTPRVHALWFGLFPLSLAATQEIDVSFFSSAYLDVSSSAGSLPYVMDWRMDT